MSIADSLLRPFSLLSLLVGLLQAEGVQDFADETNIQLWTCDGSVGQKWQVILCMQLVAMGRGGTTESLFYFQSS